MPTMAQALGMTEDEMEEAVIGCFGSALDFMPECDEDVASLRHAARHDAWLSERVTVADVLAVLDAEALRRERAMRFAHQPGMPYDQYRQARQRWQDATRASALVGDLLKAAYGNR